MVEVDHGNQLVTRYAHASRTFVKPGDSVRRGQKIAEVGTTGRSTSAHLHFEFMVQGVFQDPQKFLRAGGRCGRQACCNRANAGRARFGWSFAGRQVKSPVRSLLPDDAVLAIGGGSPT